MDSRKVSLQGILDVKNKPKTQKALELWLYMSDDAWSNLDKVDQKII